MGNEFDGVVEVVAEYGQRIGTDVSALTVWHMGGAVARVGEAEIASTDEMQSSPSTSPVAQRAGMALRRSEVGTRYWLALTPYQTSIYVNFLLEEGEESGSDRPTERQSTSR